MSDRGKNWGVVFGVVVLFVCGGAAYVYFGRPKEPATSQDVAVVSPTVGCGKEVADYNLAVAGKSTTPPPLSKQCVNAEPNISEPNEFRGCRQIVATFNVAMKEHKRSGSPEPPPIDERCQRFIAYQPGIVLESAN